MLVGENMGPGPQEISILLAIGPALAAVWSLQAFKRQLSLLVVTRATSVDSLFEAARTTKIDVASIRSCLRHGPRSGIAALQKIHESFPGVRSVILFEDSETQLVKTGLRAGSQGVRRGNFLGRQRNLPGCERCGVTIMTSECPPIGTLIQLTVSPTRNHRNDAGVELQGQGAGSGNGPTGFAASVQLNPEARERSRANVLG